MSFRRMALIVILMAIPSWLLFGPIGAWHHMVIFGIFRCMMWNGEDPTQVHLRIGNESFEVLMDPECLALSVVCWAALYWFFLAATRPNQEPSQNSGGAKQHS
jgi:hypothetical protein